VIDIRALRRHRGITLIDLARLSNLPVGTLAELEHGLLPLEDERRARLACIFGVAPELLSAPAPHRARNTRAMVWSKRCAYIVLAAALGLLFLAIPALNERPAAASTAQHPDALHNSSFSSRPARAQASRARSAPKPTPTAAPSPAPRPRFTLGADGPHGCPLAPTTGHVVVTQGYAEGTHAPTSIWGAIDLAIDGDGDGNADPAATQGVPIAAALSGMAHVYLGSWPGGNYVRITDAQSGWSAAYAHLDSVAVADGQTIPVGAPIGTVGSTGMASGPHLHYEVWHGTQNVDPSGLAECG